MILCFSRVRVTYQTILFQSGKKIIINYVHILNFSTVAHYSQGNHTDLIDHNNLRKRYRIQHQAIKTKFEFHQVRIGIHQTIPNVNQKTILSEHDCETFIVDLDRKVVSNN